MKSSRSEFVAIRGLRYHLRHWGEESAPLLLLLHGWMDVSASFQFLVDELRADWHVVAPDWRGYGQTEWPQTDSYWFPDYVGDCDAIVRHLSPNMPINLVGHSMGGNVACIYAGVRPERVKKLVNLEGLGLPASQPEQAPRRYAKWLDELAQPPRMRTYANVEEVAQRLQQNNPRLKSTRAHFLAMHWAGQDEKGQWKILGDAAHKTINPLLYRLEEVLACWRAVTAPVLWVEAAESQNWNVLARDAAAFKTAVHERIQNFARVEFAEIADAGHMLHHDQPEKVAQLIERFLLEP